MAKKVKGRGARDKGSRAERQVRDMLRSIYPKDKRSCVYRIPLSGAGAIKGDVADNNDYDSCYEVKNQENLKLAEWWEQTKAQAGATRTPILVVTQSYRPYYFIMLHSAWISTVSSTVFEGFSSSRQVSTGRRFFDEISLNGPREIGLISLHGDECAVIPSEFYLEVKKDQYESRQNPSSVL